MVREPLDYEYSSYHLFVSEAQPDEKISQLLEEIVDTKRVLRCFQHNPREQYRMFVEGRENHEEHEQLIRKEMREDEYWLP